MDDIQLPSVMDEVARILKEVEELDSLSESDEEGSYIDTLGKLDPHASTRDDEDLYTPPNRGGGEEAFLYEVITDPNSQFHRLLKLLRGSDFDDDICSLHVNIDRLRERGIYKVEPGEESDTAPSEFNEREILKRFSEASKKIWDNESERVECNDMEDHQLFSKAMDKFQKYMEEQEEDFLPPMPPPSEDVLEKDLDKMDEEYKRAKEELYLAIGERPNFKMAEPHYIPKWDVNATFEENLEKLKPEEFDDFSWMATKTERFPDFDFQGHYDDGDQDDDTTEEPEEVKEPLPKEEKPQENLDDLSEDFFGLEIDDDDEEAQSGEDASKEIQWSEGNSQSVDDWLGPDTHKLGEWTKPSDSTEEPIKAAYVAAHVLLCEELRDDPLEEDDDDDEETIILGTMMREEGLIPDWKGSLLAAFGKEEVEREMAAERPFLCQLDNLVLDRVVEQPCRYPYGKVSSVLLDYERKQLTEKSKLPLESLESFVEDVPPPKMEEKKFTSPPEVVQLTSRFQPKKALPAVKPKKPPEVEEHIPPEKESVKPKGHSQKPGNRAVKDKAKKKRGWKKFDEELSD